MTRAATLQADLATIPGVSYVAPRKVVALPPSSLDPSTVIDGTVYDETTTYTASTLYVVIELFDRLRVYVDGSLITRDYDSEMS